MSQSSGIMGDRLARNNFNIGHVDAVSAASRILGRISGGSGVSAPLQQPALQFGQVYRMNHQVSKQGEKMTSEPVTEELVRTEVKRLIAELTERDADEITDTALFVDDLGVDSLMAIEVMVNLDKRYKIDIPESEFNQIKNVNDSVATVMKHITGKVAQ
jgi:acyl carrier protein